MLTVGVLGPVEARRDGVPLPVPAGKTAELLARLALDVGRPVRVDTLVEDLWGEPATRNTLQSKVSQLRRTIGRELVVGEGDGYRLALPPAAVDAAELSRLAAVSASAANAGDPTTSLAAARAGLALFRGDVLPELGDWFAPHRARFEEVRLTLTERVLAGRVDLGAGGEIVAELEPLLVEHPLREGLWATMITALYRAGRQADALAAYQRVRRLLDDELGVSPGPDLRRLEQQILQQSPQLGNGGARGTTAPGNLPPLIGSTIGRGSDVAEVVSALAAGRLVTILGPAGVGKTRLALEVAHQLDPAPGGVWLIRLDGVDPSADLTDAVAETLRIVGGVSALLDRLVGADSVLLLDNCEHLVGPVAELVESLLTVAPRLTVLATSQVSLGLAEEHQHVLSPLGHQESVVLFEERARQRRPGLVLDTGVRAAVEEICRSLDGLPLAIELAAARTRSLSVRDIAHRLDDRFGLLRDPSSSRPERRRALVGAIAWSYDLLFPDDQRALWALSCFVGGASLDGVGWVLAALDVPEEAVADTIGRLVERSLVIVDEAGSGDVRYRLLDSIRLYAGERLRESGRASAALAAHARWFGRLAAWCDQHVRSERQPECLVIARAERANVDAALRWCAEQEPVLGATIAVDFGWTWVVLGDGTSGAARVRNALDGSLARDGVTGLLLVAWLESSAGNVLLAQQDLDRARRLAADLADDVLVADVERYQAFVAIQEGRPALARTAATASLVTYRAQRLDWSMAAALLLGGYAALMVGDLGTSSRAATEALALLEQIGDAWGLVHAQAMLGAVAQAEHRFADAARTLERAAETSVALGFLGQAALHRATLARVQQRAGDPRAAASYEQALQAASVSGDGRLAATARLNLARLRRSTGDTAAAVALWQENERWYAAAGGGDQALLNRCLLAAARGDQDELSEVLTEAEQSSDVESLVHALDGLARSAAAGADLSLARSLLERGDALAATIAHLVDAADRIDAEVRRLVSTTAGDSESRSRRDVGGLRRDQPGINQNPPPDPDPTRPDRAEGSGRLRRAPRPAR